MIESIGYTDDGFVWMKINFEVNGDMNSMVVTMSQDKARQVSEMLILATTEADAKHRMMMQ